MYIDLELELALDFADCLESRSHGMPNQQERAIDYVLYSDDGPLAIVEAKKTSVSQGGQVQANVC